MEFDKRDNTQGQVYYPLASMKGKDGLLYFGGTDGFTVVDPEKMSYNNYNPQAIISDFLLITRLYSLVMCKMIHLKLLY